MSCAVSIQQQIDAAGDEVLRLLLVNGREFGKRRLRQGGVRRGDEHAGRSERARNEPRLAGGREAVRRRARDLRAAALTSATRSPRPYFVELEPGSGERVRLDNVRPGLEVGAVTSDMMSGRDSTIASLQPWYAAPAEIASASWRAINSVPIAPSKTRTLSQAASR